MKRNLRIIAVLAVFMLAAVACGGGNAPVEEKTTGSYGSGVDLDDVGKKKKLQTQTQTQAQARGGTGSGSAPQTGGTNPHKPSSGGFVPDLTTDHPVDGGKTGQNAHYYLNKKTPRLVIEIDAVPGYEPSQAAVALMTQRIRGVADKPDGIDVLPIEKTVRPRSTWSMDDVKKAEDENRDAFNSREQAVMYVLYVNGEPNRPEPIGSAYSASSVVIYIEKIRGVATPIVGPEGIEKATLIHEIGHILALVGLTYKSPRPHEDPNSPGHSNNRNSVMYYAVEHVNVVQLLGGRAEPPNAFDKDDLADLADLKSGKLG